MSWRIWRWWLAGIILYLIFLVATLPAGYAAAWLQKRAPQLQFSDVSGSLWSGSAHEVAWQGQAWGNLHWRFDWSALFGGRLGYRLDLDAPDLALRARVAGDSHKLLLRDVIGHLNIVRLEPWLPLPHGSVAGQLNLQLGQLILVNGQPTAAAGVISLSNLNLTWPQSVALGDYELKLQAEADGIHGNMLDTSGPLMLQGSLRFAPDGSYQVSGTLASRDPGNTAIANLLRYLPTDQAGNHTFAFSGKDK